MHMNIFTCMLYTFLYAYVSLHESESMNQFFPSIFCAASRLLIAEESYIIAFITNF